MLRFFRRTLRRVFPRYRTGGRNTDPSSDQLGAAMGVKEQGYDNGVPGAAPTGYVRAYDEGRPKH